jgi:hypothetical protein
MDPGDRHSPGIRWHERLAFKERPSFGASLRNQIVEVSLELSGRPNRAFECNAHHRVCVALGLAVSHVSGKAVRLLSLLPLI